MKRISIFDAVLAPQTRKKLTTAQKIVAVIGNVIWLVFAVALFAIVEAKLIDVISGWVAASAKQPVQFAVKFIILIIGIVIIVYPAAKGDYDE